jgi:alpha/beta hydrolase family protein
MATFVLVHGSWAGGVVWRQLAPRLRKAGHEVYAPTLTGIGERKHLLNREIDLDTHIQDVIESCYTTLVLPRLPAISPPCTSAGRVQKRRGSMKQRSYASGTVRYQRNVMPAL